MGRQINFFLQGEDQNEFDILLKSCGSPIFLSYYHYDSQLSITDDTLMRDRKKEGGRIYLVRPLDVGIMQLKFIENFGYYLLKDNELPVLHYDRCASTDNEIHRGRLYFEPKYVRDMQWIEKSDDFVKWADNIIKTVRRKLKKHTINAGGWSYQEYVGKNAAIWIDNNKPESKMGGSFIKF